MKGALVFPDHIWRRAEDIDLALRVDNRVVRAGVDTSVAACTSFLFACGISM